MRLYIMINTIRQFAKLYLENIPINTKNTKNTYNNRYIAYNKKDYREDCIKCVTNNYGGYEQACIDIDHYNEMSDKLFVSSILTSKKKIKYKLPKEFEEFYKLYPNGINFKNSKEIYFKKNFCWIVVF